MIPPNLGGGGARTLYMVPPNLGGGGGARTLYMIPPNLAAPLEPTPKMV